MLRKISQRRTMVYFIIYAWNLKKKKKVEKKKKLMHRTKQKQAHRYRKQTSGDQ